VFYLNKEELLDLIKTGEGYTLEFKESFSSSIDKEICAFANANGGKILLGVDNNNQIVGFSSSNSLVSQIQDIARNMDPSFKVTFEMKDNIGIIYVPEGRDKPYSAGGRFYLRQGANSQRMNRAELLKFLQNSNQISFEKQINEDFDFENDFDVAKFNAFVSKTSIDSPLSKMHILKNLNLLTEDKPNNACVLLFSHRITKFFLSGDISCVLYKTENKSEMLDKKEFNADFISNFDNAVSFILRNTRTLVEIKGRERLEQSEIPEEALREAIINAMIHKDYFLEGRILIEIFPSKIVIANPGKLLFDKKELGKVSMTRNPILSDCMFRVGLVEKIGSGISRMQTLFPSVKFELSLNWFKITFPRINEVKRKKRVEKFKITKNELKNKKISKEVLLDYLGESWEKVGRTLGVTQLKLIIILSAKKEITIRELASELDISTTAVENNLKKLKDSGILERLGSDKEGSWEISHP